MKRRRRFPILVERWRGQQACMVGCNACGRTTVAEVSQVIAVTERGGECPHCREYALEPAYFEATRCPGCRKLHFPPEGDGKPLFGAACSWRCQRVGEHAEFLRERLKRAVASLPWRGYA